jgi:epoxyqueuosine reductase
VSDNKGITVKEAIRSKAIELGFDKAAFAAATAGPSDGAHLADFLARGRHGDMDWMARNAERRAAPNALWPEARSIVVLALNYGPRDNPGALLERRERGSISVYSQGRDYHDLVKRRLKTLGRWMVETYSCDIKVFVDTAPVMEKPLAARAGIGWQGKHTNLLNNEFGSWFFLGEVFTDLEIEADAPAVDHCGTCDLCRTACPTDALAEPYRIDPTRCISYLTIEHKGDIDSDLAEQMGNHIYGCDDCLAACPWNKFAKPTSESGLLPRIELTAPRLADLVQLDDDGFRQTFAGSPIKRSGRDRFVRNVLVAIGNSADKSLQKACTQLLDDPSPLVRRAAAWAADRLNRAPRP